MYQKTFFSLSVYNKIEWKGPPRNQGGTILTNSWVLSEPQEIVAHHTAHQLNLPLWETRSGQVRITYNTRLYEGRGWWVRNVFNMILFPYLFDEKCKTKKNPSFRLGNASLFCPLSPSPYIKMRKKEGELASLIPVFDLFHLCPARCHLCWRKKPCREWRGAKDLPLNSASRGSTLPPWISKAPLAWAKMGIRNKDGSPLHSAREWTRVSSVNV